MYTTITSVGERMGTVTAVASADDDDDV